MLTAKKSAVSAAFQIPSIFTFVFLLILFFLFVTYYSWIFFHENIQNERGMGGREQQQQHRQQEAKLKIQSYDKSNDGQNGNTVFSLTHTHTRSWFPLPANGAVSLFRKRRISPFECGKQRSMIYICIRWWKQKGYLVRSVSHKWIWEIRLSFRTYTPLLSLCTRRLLFLFLFPFRIMPPMFCVCLLLCTRQHHKQSLLLRPHRLFAMAFGNTKAMYTLVMLAIWNSIFVVSLTHSITGCMTHRTRHTIHGNANIKFKFIQLQNNQKYAFRISFFRPF